MFGIWQNEICYDFITRPEARLVRDATALARMGHNCIQLAREGKS